MMATTGPWPYFDKQVPVRPVGPPRPFMDGYSSELQKLVLSMLYVDINARPSIEDVVRDLATLSHRSSAPV
jgi:hypothetical protein